MALSRAMADIDVTEEQALATDALNKVFAVKLKALHRMMDDRVQFLNDLGILSGGLELSLDEQHMPTFKGMPSPEEWVCLSQQEKQMMRRKWAEKQQEHGKATQTGSNNLDVAKPAATEREYYREKILMSRKDNGVSSNGSNPAEPSATESQYFQVKPLVSNEDMSDLIRGLRARGKLSHISITRFEGSLLLRQFGQAAHAGSGWTIEEIRDDSAAVLREYNRDMNRLSGLLLQCRAPEFSAPPIDTWFIPTMCRISGVETGQETSCAERSDELMTKMNAWDATTATAICNMLNAYNAYHECDGPTGRPLLDWFTTALSQFMADRAADVAAAGLAGWTAKWRS